jgi:hypothetical protein
LRPFERRQNNEDIGPSSATFGHSIYISILVSKGTFRVISPQQFDPSYFRVFSQYYCQGALFTAESVVMRIAGILAETPIATLSRAGLCSSLRLGSSITHSTFHVNPLKVVGSMKSNRNGTLLRSFAKALRVAVFSWLCASCTHGPALGPNNAGQLDPGVCVGPALPTFEEKVKRSPAIVIARIDRAVLYTKDTGDEFSLLVDALPAQPSELPGAMEITVVERLKWNYAVQADAPKVLISGFSAASINEKHRGELVILFLENYNYRRTDLRDYFYNSFVMGFTTWRVPFQWEPVDKAPQIRKLLAATGTSAQAAGELK